MWPAKSVTLSAWKEWGSREREGKRERENGEREGRERERQMKECENGENLGFLRKFFRS